MSLPNCHKCKRTLAEGESAWASDWKVIDVSGTTAAFRTEARYTCDDCMSDLGFCPKDGDSMPCLTCGAGL